MSKRFGLLSILTLLAIVGVAAVVAQAGGDPAKPECASQYVAVGDVMPSQDSVHPTPTEAAAAFASNMQAEGKPIPTEMELVDVTGSDAAIDDLGGEAIIAARVDGKTKVLMGLVQEGGGWVVQSFISC